MTEIIDSEDLAAKVRASLERALREFGDDLCGFAAVTDDSFMCLSVAINTRTHLRHIQADNPDYATACRWSVGEWADELFDCDAYAEMGARLYESALSDSPALDVRRSFVLDEAVHVLKQARTIFADRLADDFVMMIEITDPDDETMVDDMIRFINPPHIVEAFEAWRMAV